jgi:hypothetical protein
LHRAVHAEKTLVIKSLQEFEGQQHSFFSTDLWLDACAGLCSHEAPGGLPGGHVAKGLRELTFTGEVAGVKSGIGKQTGLFLDDFWLLIPVQGDTTAPIEEIRSVIYGQAATDVFEHKFWDLGSSESLKFIRFGVDFAPIRHHEVHIAGLEYRFWDPGLLDSSRWIEVTRFYADRTPAFLHEFLIVLLTPRKCGGCPGRDIHYVVLVSDQWRFSVASFSESSLASIVFKFSPTAVIWCIKDLVLIWIISSTGAVMLSSCALIISQVPCIAIYLLQNYVLGPTSRPSEIECVLCFLFPAEITETVERSYPSDEGSLLSYWDRDREAVKCMRWSGAYFLFHLVTGQETKCY